MCQAAPVWHQLMYNVFELGGLQRCILTSAWRLVGFQVVRNCIDEEKVEEGSLKVSFAIYD